MKNYSILFYTGGAGPPPPPPPDPSPWYATVFGLTVGEGYAVSVDYLIACDMIVYLIKVILTVNYYLYFQVFKLNLQDPTIVQYAKGEFTASFPFHLSISS